MKLPFRSAFIKCLFSAVFVSAVYVPVSFSEISFEAWKNQQESAVEETKDAFETYKAELNSAFKEYKRKTSGVWGKHNVNPNRKNWVSYIDKLNQRSVVDFEKGTVYVEVALPVNQRIDDVSRQKLLEDTLLKAMRLGDDKRSIEKFAKQPISQPKGKAVLQGLISLPDGTVADAEDYKRLAIDAASAVKKTTLRGADGKKRVVYSTRLKLVPDHIRIRARQYEPLVHKYSAAHKVPVAVVFAVIETESMFNPTARSAAPAFGLMQLVPTSGARDAYQYLYNKDKVVTDTYLYVPENNIRLGAAYLSRLNTAYLNGIKSDKSRLIATIAAYNTGAGNVFRAFSGKYSRARHGSYTKYKTRALAEINKRTPEQVYKYLRRHLPYRETRDYIKKVTERMSKYAIS